MNTLWQERLVAGATLLLDGGTGSELRRRGLTLSTATWSGAAPLHEPEMLREIHADYVAAGADVITTNTFATTRFVLAAGGLAHEFASINAHAVAAARAACETSSRGIAVAGSISCLPPRFDVRAYPDAASECAAYHELAQHLAHSGVNLLALEMLQDPVHGARACEAAAATGLPWWLGVSCRQLTDGTLVGYDLEEHGLHTVLDALLPYEPAAVCIMHSSPSATLAAVSTLHQEWGGIIGAYPEWLAGDAEEFATFVEQLCAAGTHIVGGCCGTTPAHIRAARRVVDAVNGPLEHVTAGT